MGGPFENLSPPGPGILRQKTCDMQAPDLGCAGHARSLHPASSGLDPRSSRWALLDSNQAPPGFCVHRRATSVAWGGLEARGRLNGRSHSQPPVKPARRRPATTGGQRRMMFQSKPLR